MSGTSMATPQGAGVAALWTEKLRNEGVLQVPESVRSAMRARGETAPAHEGPGRDRRRDGPGTSGVVRAGGGSSSGAMRLSRAQAEIPSAERYWENSTDASESVSSAPAIAILHSNMYGNSFDEGVEKVRQQLADAELSGGLARRALRTLTGLDAEGEAEDLADDLHPEAPLAGWEEAARTRPPGSGSPPASSRAAPPARRRRPPRRSRSWSWSRPSATGSTRRPPRMSDTSRCPQVCCTSGSAQRRWWAPAS